jgi:gliding motility-associated-like protein
MRGGCFAFFLLFSGLVNAQSFPNPITLSTGQGPPKTLDPIWQCSSGWTINPPPSTLSLTYSPALINNNCAPGSWVNPSNLPPPVNNGNWITSSLDSCATNKDTDYIVFRLPIDLPASCNGKSIATQGLFVLNFNGYVDNTIANVFVNGVATGFTGGSYSLGTELSMRLSGPWVGGKNYIDVLVYNTPNGPGPVEKNPYGLLLVCNTNDSISVCKSCVLPDSIPNVFTPNGDGINDRFTLKSQSLSQLSCQIFNRWGLKINEFNTVNGSWDGNTDSGQAPNGTYYYLVNASCFDGTKSVSRGFVQLLR